MLTIESRPDADIAPRTTTAATESEVDLAPLETTSPIRRMPVFVLPSEYRQFGIERGRERGLVQPIPVLYQRFTEGGVRDSQQSELRTNRTQARPRIDMDGTAPSVSMSGMHGMSALDALDTKREVRASRKKQGSKAPSVRFI
jgi:hypothetical protein